MGNKDKNLPFIVCSIFFVSILLFSQIFSSDFRIKILNIFRTPLKIASGTSYVLRDVAGFKESRVQLKILRETIDNLEKEILNLHEEHLENKRLKGLLDFRESKKHRFIPAMVIARDPLGARDTIIIDKGKKHDVRKDMVVISGSGLVGRVREAGPSPDASLLRIATQW